MGSFLLLGDGDTLELGTGAGSLLLGDQTATVPLAIRFADEDLQVPESPTEEVNGFFSDNLIDEEDRKVEKSVIEAVTLHVLDKASNAVMMQADGLDANGVTITEENLYTELKWLFDFQATRLTNRANTQETRSVMFEIGWGSASSGSTTAAIDTTLLSTADVTITGHGLATTSDAYSHQVFLQAAAAVGGVIISGGYTVKTVVDANTLRIVLPCAATLEVAGGGALDWWINGRVSKPSMRLNITRDERYCS